MQIRCLLSKCILYPNAPKDKYYEPLNYKRARLPENLSFLDKEFSNVPDPLIDLLKRGDDMLIIGDTLLSRGQIRAAIKQRTVTIAKVLDCGGNWHSFYYTYKSVNGEENGNIPHIQDGSNKK